MELSASLRPFLTFGTSKKRPRRTWRRSLGREGCRATSTRCQTHDLQTAYRDNIIIRWHHKSCPGLQRTLDRTDSVGVGLRRGGGSCVSQSRSFTHWHDSQRYLLRPQRRQGYTGSACMKNDTQRYGNGSFKLIWRLRSVISQNDSLGGVSILTPYYWLCGAGIDVDNEHTVGAPLFFDGSPAPGLWLGSLLTTLARCLVAPFPSARRVFYSHVPLVWISQTVVFSALTMFLWFCACAPVCVLLQTLTDLTCSCRSDEF